MRHGHAPKRVIQTGIGGIEVQRPRVRDRGADGAARIRFTSAVLPAYLRRAKNIEELLPWLYLILRRHRCARIKAFDQGRSRANGNREF